VNRRPQPPARVARDGDALVFTGALVRDAIALLWPRALAAAADVVRHDLRAVNRVDSAGLALLAELSARGARPVELLGSPEGLQELRTAYRLDHALRPAG
jgi:phospholipid transport system transporter-binding protein